MLKINFIKLMALLTMVSGFALKARADIPFQLFCQSKSKSLQAMGTVLGEDQISMQLLSVIAPEIQGIDLQTLRDPSYSILSSDDSAEVVDIAFPIGRAGVQIVSLILDVNIAKRMITSDEKTYVEKNIGAWIRVRNNTQKIVTSELRNPELYCIIQKY